jgi:hypothetical protein
MLWQSVVLLSVVGLAGCWREPWEVHRLKISGPRPEYLGQDLGRYPEHTINGVVFRLSVRPKEDGLWL